MEKPVICFDLDGTLVNERGEIHSQDLAILSLEPAPAVFIPCTGRLHQAVRRLFTRHNLYQDSLMPFPMVLQNGASLYGRGEKPLAYSAFSMPIQRFLLDLVLSTPEATFFIFGEDQVYVHWPTPFSDAMSLRFDTDMQPFDPQSGMSFSKIMVLSESSDVLAHVARHALHDGIEQAYSLKTVLEFNPAGVNKGSALTTMLDMLDLKNSPLATAGDGENDLSMLSLSPYSIAPDNAPEHIKAQAAKVINVAENGVLAPLLALIKDR